MDIELIWYVVMLAAAALLLSLVPVLKGTFPWWALAAVLSGVVLVLSLVEALGD